MKNITNSSPFKIRYVNELRPKFLANLATNSKTIEMNKFFCPGLFHLIANKIHLLPVWSSSLVVLLSESTCLTIQYLKRIINNCSEQNFNITKNRIVVRSGSMPSEIAALSYERLRYIFNGIFQF